MTETETTEADAHDCMPDPMMQGDCRICGSSIRMQNAARNAQKPPETETKDAFLRRIIRCQEKAAAGEIDLRDVGQLLFGKWDQDWPAELLRLAARGAAVPDDMVAIPKADYERLLEGAEADDMIVRCETCNAWLDRSDPACAVVNDYTGCWKVAAGEDDNGNNCRSYRSTALKTGASS